MERIDGRLIVSATDLVGHLACGHLTVLNHGAKAGERRPTRSEADAAALGVTQRRGDEHEQAHLAQLRSTATVVEISPPDATLGRIDGLLQREQQTRDAMVAGADVVFQATFLDQRGEVLWRGHADFLHRVDIPSDLGDHAYEPEDTKLALSVKPATVLQLCHYAEQVERLQGVAPRTVHVALGDGRRESLDLVEVAAYYRAARDSFLADLAAGPETYPLPVSHCAICSWAESCDARREADDHLCRVAGLGRDQARKLEAAGIPTLGALAKVDPARRVAGMGAATLPRLHHQARLQAQRVDGQPPPFELDADVGEGRGFDLLPPPSPGDVFYDIEGDPYVGADGLEYLHGLGWVGDDGGFHFEAHWAHDPAGERAAFEAVIDRIVERRRPHPDLHVYHYANYERTALGHLMGRYGTREHELDDLLRGEVLVDLYKVVRQGLVIGSPSYSLKKLEPLYMPPREGAITDAGSSIVQYEEWLETGDDQILRDIEAYNCDDVESTWRLRDWLLGVRDGGAGAADTAGLAAFESEGAGTQTVATTGEEAVPEVREGASPDAPSPPAGDEPLATDAAPIASSDGPTSREQEDAEVDALQAELLSGLDDAVPPAEDSEERARWLMAQLLAWHRREDRPEWWRYFSRVLEADDADLYDDTEAIAGLHQVGDPVPFKQSLIWRYEFDPDQEHKLRPGAPVKDPDADRRALANGRSATAPGELVAMDATLGTLNLKRGKRSKAPHPHALIPPGPLKTPEQRASLRRLTRALLDHGIDGAGPGRAARQLLARRPPLVADAVPGIPLRADGEPTLDAATRLISGLDRSYLPIQGPPGAGKTFTAAKAVVALLRQGRRVGITAGSHNVISTVLKQVVAEADAAGVPCRAIQKAAEGAGVDHPSVTLASNNKGVEDALAGGEVDVVAGTAWLFSRETLVDTLDTLIIDEAGQLALANVCAVAMSARNLVLVGDPRQLAQPSKCAHPEGAGASGLEHVLSDAATVPDDLGLFLDRTWRLHPEITAFISEQVYEGRLESKDHCARQTIAPGPVLGGSGLRWAPVDHADDRTSSPDEAAEVTRIHRALLGRSWTDGEGTPRTIGVEDILVVAPYNAQRRLLIEALPEGARVGTVDSYQGQEAAVAIVSLAASSAEDVPRGMEFLYSRNRLNVAVSRAQALAVVVASPALLTPRCRSVAQVRLANVLCRYVEMATVVDASA